MVAMRAPLILVTPAGDSVEPPACGASDALNVPAYRSAACVISAVRGGDGKVLMTAVPAGRMPEGDHDWLGDMRRMTRYRNLLGA